MELLLALSLLCMFALGIGHIDAGGKEKTPQSNTELHERDSYVLK
jgi:hypothetical protein